MKNKINNKGFTLIELLAIIAITAIILGVGTYGIVNLVERSNEKASLISETSIKESASLYADEAGDSLWIDPGSGDYKYYCITIEELINKGIIKKNAKLPKGIDKYNYVSIKKNKVTFVKNDPVILEIILIKIVLFWALLWLICLKLIIFIIIKLLLSIEKMIVL